MINVSPKATGSSSSNPESMNAKTISQRIVDYGSELICPISLEMMQDAATLDCGHSFDKKSVEKLKQINYSISCPSCREPSTEVRVNPAINRFIYALKQHFPQNILENDRVLSLSTESLASFAEEVQLFAQDFEAPKLFDATRRQFTSPNNSVVDVQNDHAMRGFADVLRMHLQSGYTPQSLWNYNRR